MGDERCFGVFDEKETKPSSLLAEKRRNTTRSFSRRGQSFLFGCLLLGFFLEMNQN
jgi:hypothetical protein